MSAAVPPGFRDIGPKVRRARAACAASRAELHRAAELVALEILRLERVNELVTALAAELEERLSAGARAA
jgi:hypothetical protein